MADLIHTTLYRGTAGAGHWLQLDLKGASKNVLGLGALAELVVDGRRQVRELQSGYGYCSQVQPRLHFGLGESAMVDSLRITWPDGQQSLRTRIPADQRISITHPRLASETSITADVSLPVRTELLANYPNPFNTATLIPFSLGSDGPARLEVFSVTGQRIIRLVDQSLTAGHHRTSWNGRDGEGRTVGSGVYFYRLTAQGLERSRRLLLLK